MICVCCLFKEYRGAYVMVLMAVLWITEALPLAVTSLLPAILAPALGILTSKQIAANYFKVSTIRNLLDMDD